jgi:predicted NBD/HSP70 family sugar kinase
MLAKQSQSHVRRNNLHLILNTIIRHEPVSRAELVRLTHISKPTVSGLADELLARNLVIEAGEGQSRTGRKPILLQFNSRLKYFLAFDIGHRAYQIAVSDLKGRIMGKQNGEFSRSQSYQDRLAVLHEQIVALLQRLQLSAESLLKIHGTAPGVYVEKGKGLRWFSGNGAHEDHDMQQFFEQEFQIPVLINHSTKLALLGEKIAGKARGFSDVIYIDLGYGLGGAFMFADRLHFGADASAGEIGYTYPDFKEFEAARLAPYTNGALERLISAQALQAKGVELARRYETTKMLELAQGDPEQITTKTVFQAAMQDDPYAYALLKDALKYLNITLCNLINALNPELVILGGGISKVGDFLLDLIVPEIEEKVLIMPQFEMSALQDEASVIGALAYLREHTDCLTEL